MIRFPDHLCLVINPNVSPDSDKICMCHSLQRDPTPCKNPARSPESFCLLWRAWLDLKTDMVRYSKCDNINNFSKINKAAVHSLWVQQIVWHSCSTILLRVTGSLLLSWWRRITCKVTKSSTWKYTVALYFPKGIPFLHRSPKCQFISYHLWIFIRHQLCCTNKAVLGCNFCGCKFIFNRRGHLSLSESQLTWSPFTKRNPCFDRRCRSRHWDSHCRGSSGLQGLYPQVLSHSGVKPLSQHTKANIALDLQRHSVCCSPRASPPVTKIEATSHQDMASQLA